MSTRWTTSVFGRQHGQHVLLHAPQDEWLQHVACVGDCLLRCVGGGELLGGFAHRLGVRGVEKGEEREELLEVVLHGRAGEEERVVCFDLAESLCVTQQRGGNEEAFGGAVFDAVALVEDQQVVGVMCDEVSVAVHCISFKQTISTIGGGDAPSRRQQDGEGGRGSPRSSSSGLPLYTTTLAPLHHVSISLFQLYTRLVGTTIRQRRHCAFFTLFSFFTLCVFCTFFSLSTLCEFSSPSEHGTPSEHGPFGECGTPCRWRR